MNHSGATSSEASHMFFKIKKLCADVLKEAHPWPSAFGGKRALAPLEIGAKNEKPLKNLKSAA